MKTHAYFDSGDARQLVEQLRHLQTGAYLSRNDAMQKALAAFTPESVAATPVWEDLQNQFSDLLHAFALWTPGGSEVDILHQKATVLTGLLSSTSSKDAFGQIASMAVALLSNSGAQRENPAEWMWQVKSIAEAGGPPILDAYRTSGNAGLGLYATFHPR